MNRKNLNPLFYFSGTGGCLATAKNISEALPEYEPIPIASYLTGYSTIVNSVWPASIFARNKPFSGRMSHKKRGGIILKVSHLRTFPNKSKLKIISLSIEKEREYRSFLRVDIANKSITATTMG